MIEIKIIIQDTNIKQGYNIGDAMYLSLLEKIIFLQLKD